MTTLLPPTPTPIPEQPEEQKPTKAAKKLLPTIVRVVWHPIVAIAIVLHAFLLFIPLEKPKPKPSPTPSPIDKNVKIDRISLAKRAAPPPQPKPRPKTNRRPKTNVKPANRVRKAPAPRQSPQPRDEPPLDDNQTPETPITSAPASTSGPGSPPSPDAGGGDPCNWAGLIQREYLQLSDNLPEITPNKFSQPGLYYDGDARKAIVADIVEIPRTTGLLSAGTQVQRSIETVENDLRQACQQQAANFQKVKEVGSDILYYVRKEGQPGAYLTLAKGRGTSAASIFLVLWAGDPTNNFR